MDLGLSEFQQKTKDIAGQFLERECPKSLLRELEAGDTGHSPEVWAKMGELGWQGLPLPEAAGGLGGSLVDAAVIVEEMGYAAYASPFMQTTAVALLLAESGGFDDPLRAVAEGGRILTSAIAEASGFWTAEGIGLTAVADGDEFVLSGEKRFVEWAAVADQMLVAARAPASSGSAGLILAVVDVSSAGIELTPLVTTGLDRQYVVRFDGVRVPAARIAGPPGEGGTLLVRLVEVMTALQCVYAVGCSRRALDMTVEHVQERTQFGQPLGKFQAVQHHAAEMAMLTEGARLVSYEAIWRLSENMPATRETAMAKSFTNDATRETSWLAQQLHGGVGIMREYDLHFYFREIKAAEQKLGRTRDLLETVAGELGI